MEIEEDGKHKNKISDFHGETLKENRPGTRVVEIVDLLRQRKRREITRSMASSKSAAIWERRYSNQAKKGG